VIARRGGEAGDRVPAATAAAQAEDLMPRQQVSALRAARIV